MTRLITLAMVRASAGSSLTAFRLAVLLFVLLPTEAPAQAVYRCETAGKVAYSDAPCVGAQVIDATPTQGMDKMSGKSKKGKEVQRDELMRAYDDATRPIIGGTHEEREIRRRRYRLEPDVQLRCLTLDARLPQLEDAARATASEGKAERDVALFKARKQFFDLKC